MARHEHLIHAALADRYPSELVAVHCDTTTESVGDGPNTYALRLVSWSAACMRGECGNYGPARVIEGKTVDDFWSAIDGRVRRPGVLWVVSESAVQTMTLLGVWKLLETGELMGGNGDESSHDSSGRCRMPALRGASGAVDPDESGQSGDSVRELPSVRAGHAETGERKRRARRAKGGAPCVLRDPPTILSARRPGQPGRLQWIDLANYAVAPLRPGPLARQRSERAIGFVRSAIGLVRDEGLGSWSATVGSQSEVAWRRRHQTHAVLADIGDARAALVAEGYYGGRCEAFVIGSVAGPVSHVDVAAFYPSIYAERDVPICPEGPVMHGSDPTERDPEAAIACIADVSLATSEPAYPYRHHELGVTVWPVGRFRTVLPGPELAHAVRAKRVRKWHRWQRYRMAPALASMGKHMLELRARLAGQPELCGYVKALANCLVGKLGQRDIGWQDATFPLVAPEWGTWDVIVAPHQYQRWRSIAGRTQRQDKGGWAYGSVPAIPAWITSYARVHLWGLLRASGLRSVCYADTDSLFLSSDGLRRLVASGETLGAAPGKLSLKATYSAVRVYGIKTYEADGTVVAGGMAQPEEGQRRIGAPTVVRSGVQSALKVGTAPCATVHHVSWSPCSAYRHGIVGVDGRVRPHIIDRPD